MHDVDVDPDEADPPGVHVEDASEADSYHTGPRRAGATPWQVPARPRR